MMRRIWCVGWGGGGGEGEAMGVRRWGRVEGDTVGGMVRETQWETQ
jgi:hypothetical protein